MPLDMIRQVEARLEATRGFRAAYTFDGDQLRLVVGAAEALQEADATLSVWRAARNAAAADFLMLRQDDSVGVASAQGGLIIVGDKTLNAGLLRQVLKDLPREDIPAAGLVRDTAWGRTETAIWALAERLGRVEAPRTFEIIVGQHEYVLEVSKDQFGIVEEDGGADRLIAKIAEACESDAVIEYTLGVPKTRNIKSRHNVSQLFQETEEPKWAFEGNWPVHVPADAPFADIRAAVAVHLALTGIGKTSIRANILDENGRNMLTAKVQDQSGTQSWG